MSKLYVGKPRAYIQSMRLKTFVPITEDAGLGIFFC